MYGSPPLTIPPFHDNPCTYTHSHSVELCSSDGRKLRSFSLEECSGGPHELRAVMRSTLLHELAAVAAPEDVCYGVKATAVQQHAQGVFACCTFCDGHLWRLFFSLKLYFPWSYVSLLLVLLVSCCLTPHECVLSHHLPPQAVQRCCWIMENKYLVAAWWRVMVLAVPLPHNWEQRH